MMSLKSINQLRQEPFTATETDSIREGIRKKYRGVAKKAEGFFSYRTGRKGALALHYPAELMESLPEAITESFCGVGNPFSIREIQPGATVLDIGCGAGLDLIVAAHQTGPKGTVYGVDLTSDMVDKAEKNCKEAGMDTIQVHHIRSEELPFEPDSIDVVTSNGVINLSPRKLTLFKEIFRVLRPGGSLQFADIILEKELPPHLATGVESWSQ